MKAKVSGSTAGKAEIGFEALKLFFLTSLEPVFGEADLLE
jgi:hypothetical protein